MKKHSSKTVLHNKNKTFSTVPQSKKNSRIVKANSCIKINSLNSQQISKVTANNNSSYNKQHLSQISNKLNVNYPICQIHNMTEKPLQLRNSVRKYIKSSFEATRHDNNKNPPEDAHLKQKNQQLIKQNTSLRQKCCELQEMSLRDKEKIKNLIVRIAEVKHANTQFSVAKSMHPSTAKLTTLNNLDLNQNSASQLLPGKLRLETPFKGSVVGVCQNKECQQRRKYLQSELYRQRIVRDKLQLQKRQWQKNREDLKNQYNELLYQIQSMRDNQY